MSAPRRRFRGLALDHDEHVRLDPRPPKGRVWFEPLRFCGREDDSFFYDSSNYSLDVVIAGRSVFGFSIIKCRARYASFSANLSPAQLTEAIKTLQRLGFGRWVKPGLESLVALLKVLPNADKELFALAQRQLDARKTSSSARRPPSSER